MRGRVQCSYERPGHGGLPTLVTHLVASTEALSALSATLSLRRSGVRAVPPIEHALADVVGALGLHDVVSAVAEDELALLAEMLRARLREACELGLDPSVRPGWRPEDPGVMAAASHGAETMAPVLHTAVILALAGLAGRMESPGAAILGVGVGVGAGGLLVGQCRLCPRLAATGIDIFERRCGSRATAWRPRGACGTHPASPPERCRSRRT